MDRSVRGFRLDLLLAACVLLALIMSTALGVAGCGSSSSSSSLTTMTTIAPNSPAVSEASGANAQGPGAKVVLKAGTASPAELQVQPGSAVTFVNMDDDTTRTYHLVSADGTIDTGVLAESDSYSVTFAKAGTFEYQDKADPTIKGKIVVQ